MVIADTSAWIEFLRKPDSEVGRVVDSLLASQQIAMVGTVLAEVLQGARTEFEFDELSNRLVDLEFFDTDKQAWVNAALTASRLRRQGFQVPLSDLVIAEVAKQRHLQLYAIDGHFQLVPGLELYSPSS